MLECIQCGNVFIVGVRCPECGSTAIDPLDRDAAEEQYITKLQHHGIDMDRGSMKKLIDAVILA